MLIFEVLNFDFRKFEQFSSTKFTKNLKFQVSKIAKNYIFDSLNSLKIDFTQNLSDGKMIKFQQSQTLTSHFESFRSIVIH